MIKNSALYESLQGLKSNSQLRTWPAEVDFLELEAAFSQNNLSLEVS